MSTAWWFVAGYAAGSFVATVIAILAYERGWIRTAKPWH